MRRYQGIDSEQEKGKIEKHRVTEKELRIIHHMHEYHFKHDLILYFKIVNYKTMLYNILKAMVCHFVNELFKCLWAYRSERKRFRIFEMV